MSEQKIPAEMLDAAAEAIEKVRYDRGIGFLSSAEIAALVLSAAITGAEHVIASRQMELNQARGRITQLEKALLFVGARIEENGDTVMTCAAFNQWLKTEGDRLVRERIAELEAELGNIADAKRVNFADCGEFWDWAQNRARWTLHNNPNRIKLKSAESAGGE